MLGSGVTFADGGDGGSAGAAKTTLVMLTDEVKRGKLKQGVRRQARLRRG